MIYKYMVSLWSLRENVFTSGLHRVIGEGAELDVSIVAFLLMSFRLYQGV